MRLEEILPGRWHVYCSDCNWTSKVFPAFPNPDAALHVLHLHQQLCKGKDVPHTS